MSMVAPPSTFAEAGIPLHAKLLSAVEADGQVITPTPLLIRVLRRTALDFADVIVDGRCATGTRQVGSAAAVWVHNTNVRVNASQAAAESSSKTPQQPAGDNRASSPGTGGTNNDKAVPLYRTEAALSECRSLLVLYTLHCLLSATQEPSTDGGSSSSDSSAHVRADADGRVQQLPLAARNWAPEVSIIVAETEASAVELHRMCKSLGEACRLRLNAVLQVGDKPPASLVLSPSTPATEKGTANPEVSGAPAAASDASKHEEGGDISGTAKKTTSAGERPHLVSIIVTTAQGFLRWNLSALLSAGVDVAVAGSGTASAAAESTSDAASAGAAAAAEPSPSPEMRRVHPHVASIVVEEMGGASVTSPIGVDKAVQQWREVHHILYAAALRQNPRYVPAAHLHPHYMWVCRGPVSHLPATLRQCFSRRSRRYYQIQPSTYISPLAVALMPHPHEGLSSPAESLGIRLVLSQSQADKEAQLRRIVTDRSGLFHRVLLLTHNKEVAQLSALIASWGMSKEAPTASTVSASASNSVLFSRRMDSLGAQQQCHAAYLQSCEAAERVLPAAAAASSSLPYSSPVVVTLVAWDALTSLDIMDLDVVIQYYPPQKSLTDQEWAEFIQILHTTVDGEREIELSLRQNRHIKEDNIQEKLQQLREGTTTRPAKSAEGSEQPQRPLPVVVTLMLAADFTLSAYFLHQYMYSGATGTLTRAATATSLTSTGPAPGRPGVQEPVECPLPVLDISPKHPYFIPLVCGHTGDVEWPATAPSSPPRPRTATAGVNGAEESLLLTLTSGEAVTVKKVLVAKLEKEQRRLDGFTSLSGTAAAAKNMGFSGNSSVGAAPSPVQLLAQGNIAMTANAASGGSANLSSSGSGGAERNPFAKIAKHSGIATANYAASAAAGVVNPATAAATAIGASGVRANSRRNAGAGTGAGDGGNGSNSNQRQHQQRGGGSGKEPVSSAPNSGGGGSNSNNRRARSSAAQNSNTGGRGGSNGKDGANANGNGSLSSSSVAGGAAFNTTNAASAAAAQAAAAPSGGAIAPGSKKENETGNTTTRSPLASKSGASDPNVAYAGAKDAGSGSGGDRKGTSNKRRSRNTRGKKQQQQQQQQSSPSS
ncbi:conserved hypothetical protein [Leishmania major strain Friedlin]|uniref:Uncharacterized protein n=1 Tax=Leishmania major TaxID=5664 RepID=Q4QB62_LEIMA|nr:conserved hypothetical protein [Leishmania major strain Friedlin]CAG9574300.1 hypothetical_protein_-_conserved [Leishmania major strain Friedlin]CAJ04589.1 conserved hypothetical protein [Leishmania major strain Friedlin]|eukprot:XP_001683436.1 conserved hypothetical protein [Leishmania major strain Friedlin]